MSSPDVVELRKNRGLSHPHFESYRLAADAQPELQLAFDLPPTRQPRAPFEGLPNLGAGKYHAHVFDRFLSHHLAPGFPHAQNGCAQAAYIDAGGNVVIVCIREGDGHEQELNFHPVFKLDDGEEEDKEQTDVPRQTPSIIALDADTWLVADGQGKVTTLTVSEDPNGTLVVKARSALVPASSSSNQSQVLPVKIVAAQGSRFLTQTIERSQVSISAYDFASPLLKPPHWMATTGEPLLFAESTQDSLLVGSAPFTVSRPKKEEAKAQDTQPHFSCGSPDDAYPFTWYQTTDALTITFPLPATLAPANFDITIKSHHLTLDLDNLPDSLRISDVDAPKASTAQEAAQPRASSAVAMARITAGAFRSSSEDEEGRKLWGDVDPSASFWTWERPNPSSRATPEEQEAAIGHLTLHLEKRHHGTRWPHVFTTAASRRAASRNADGQLVSSSSVEPESKVTNSEEGAEDVPETLDPSERVTILESLEKYTSEMGGGSASGGGAGAGLGSLEWGPASGFGGTGTGGASSLLEDGFEDEDANIGRDAYLLRLPSEQDAFTGLHDEGSRTKLLGVPIPSVADAADKVLVVKDGIDGLAFTRGGSADPWTHTSTLPALAYVLASKQDASHRVYAHVGPRSAEQGTAAQVLAFEGSPPTRLNSGGASSERSRGAGTGAGAGNLFVYYAPPAGSSSRVTHAASRVIRLGAGQSGVASSGSLVAVAKVVQRVREGRERHLLLALCQSQLLVLPNLLL
ncbi:hypothetical protein OC844_003701 [Tilletia horrida]|nr:hypothetical protein OC844_003701 [Tilletia horrida]